LYKFQNKSVSNQKNGNVTFMIIESHLKKKKGNWLVFLMKWQQKKS